MTSPARPRVRPRLGPGIKERFEWAAGVAPDQSRRLRRGAGRSSAISSGLTRRCALFADLAAIAPFRNTATDEIEVEYRHQALCLLCIAGLGELPQVSLPLAELDGMPLGLSLVGRRGTDALLALTSAISQPDALADELGTPHITADSPPES
jgi:amidase